MAQRFTLILGLLLAWISAAAQYNTLHDIPYSQADDYAIERCKLDVYYPTEQKGVPVVVWFHGGGLTGGNKFIPKELENSGLAVVAVNYRLLPNASIDNCIDDAAAAVAWTFQHIAAYNGSPEKIFLAGHSAGGYLLNMIGLDKHWLAQYGVDADQIKALVPYSGQAITHFNVRAERGMAPTQAYIDEYAPLFHVRPDAPPIVIISGDREMQLYGRYEETAYFWRMLKLCGHPDVSLYELDGYDHGAMAEPAHHILKAHIRRLCGVTGNR